MTKIFAIKLYWLGVGVTPVTQITCKNWFFDMLELRDVEECSNHSFHNSNLRSNSKRQEHREKEDTPAKKQNLLTTISGRLCNAPKTWPVTVPLKVVPFRAKVVPLWAKLVL